MGVPCVPEATFSVDLMNGPTLSVYEGMPTFHSFSVVPSASIGTPGEDVVFVCYGKNIK